MVSYENQVDDEDQSAFLQRISTAYSEKNIEKVRGWARLLAIGNKVYCAFEARALIFDNF